MQNFAAINYTLITPCEALRDKVQAIWFADNLDNTVKQEFKVFSDSAAGVALNFAGELRYQRDAEKLHVGRGGLIHGASAKLLRVCFSGPIRTVGIHFYPDSGHQFLNLPMNQLAGHILLADEANFTCIDRLYSEIGELWKTPDSRKKLSWQ